MQDHTTTDPVNEIKLCECGCGFPAPIAKQNHTRSGHIKGEPVRFIQGHYGARLIEDRFWEKVDTRGPDECWIWQGSTRGGYGRLKADGKTVRAHRFSYELHNGPIPNHDSHHGMCVLHKCDNPVCVNPAHLFLGTNADNIADMIAKGRDRKVRGVRVGSAKLTPERVRHIRALHKIGASQASIAARFGVARGTIWYIVTGETWKHVQS